ncbi:MAG: amidohydrolase [Trueperaceae bacterium]|nr:amidohydrolase [Trueperaceae bacterium]
MSDTIHQAAQNLKEETIAIRRDLHAHPELAFEEVRTSAIVAQKLGELGLTNLRTGVGKTGVLALLDSGKPGKTVLARADMDALPVHEERDDLSFRSQTAGKMHACGHDGHTAILLSCAKILTQQKDSLTGKVLFVFQPAEEVVGGAKAMLEEGALGGYKVDNSIGLHLGSMLPVGTAALRAGPAMAAADALRIVIRGKGGHGAMPHMSIDPIVAASQIIMSLQTLVSRETNPVDQAVLSMTAIQAGSAYNIIPEEVEIKGTLRTFLGETRDYLHKRIVEMVETSARALRCEGKVEFVQGSPAVVNDATMTKRMANVAVGVLGEKAVEPNAPQIMGGDDMSLWLQEAPGCYFFVGAANTEKDYTYPHHHPKFAIDEASLPIAVELLTKGVIDFLND